LISKIIRTKAIDLVYERHNQFDYGTLVGTRKGIVVLLEQNGISPIEAENCGASKEQIRELIATELRVFPMADKVIAVGKDIENYYRNLGLPRDKIEYVHNGVNTDLFKPGDRIRSRLDLGFDLAEHLIGFVGDFRIYHGLEYAIRAMPYVLKEIDNAKLVIIGSNTKQRVVPNPVTVESLSKIAEFEGVSSSVLFTGNVPHVPIYLNAMDICIAPWIIERNLLSAETDRTRDLKIFEYLACGKPLLTTDVGNLKDFVEKNNIGMVVEPENPRELAKGIVALLSDKVKLAEMGMNARRLAVEKYSWRSTAEEILSIADRLRMESRVS
jgi:glycosyltransferase involved in cell wall biosynthesis